MIDFSIYMHVSFYFATNGLIMKYNYVMICLQSCNQVKRRSSIDIKMCLVVAGMKLFCRQSCIQVRGRGSASQINESSISVNYRNDSYVYRCYR